MFPETKKVLLLLAVFVLAASSGFAKGPQGVVNTWHNMSSDNVDSSWYQTDNEDEICIFCHTPHGGDLSRPLWNRTMPDQSGTPFTHYSNITLSTVLQGLSKTRPVSDESLACMSCHDGTIAVNRVLNPSNRTGGQPVINTGDEAIVPAFVGIGSIIGDSPDADNAAQGLSRDLTDDHPISFSFFDVVDGDAAAAAKLRTIAYAESQGIRFFPENAGEAAGMKRVECSSCHDPHVDYDPFGRGFGDDTYTPFLIMSNANSGLCLSCHIK